MLKVNHSHESASFLKKKPDFSVKIGAIVLAVSLFSGALSASLQSLFNLEQVISVSSDVRTSIYKDNNYVNYIREYIPASLEVDDLEDTFMTDKTLSEVLLLDLDAKKTKDFSFLEHCDKLQQLIIRNAQFLSQEAIDAMAKHAGSKKYFMFNALDVIKMSGKGMDVTSLKNMGVEILFDNEDDNRSEVNNVALYQFLKGVDASFYNPNMDFETFENIDAMLSKLLLQANLGSCKNDEEKLIQIIGVVTDYLKYDEEVNDYLNVHGLNADLDQNVAEKGMYYNLYSLSSLTTGSDEVSGICANYASLLTALCVKSGIEAYLATGQVDDGNLNHAWTIVKLGNEFRYIDCTALDSNLFYQTWLLNYELADDATSKEMYEQKLKEEIFSSLKSVSSKASIDVEKLSQRSLEDQVIYYNVNTAGNYVLNQDVDLKMPLMVGLGSGVFALFVGSLAERKRNESR